MSDERDDREQLGHSAESEETERLYQSVGAVAAQLLQREYGLTDAVIHSIVADAFFGYTGAQQNFPDPESWLADAIFDRARRYIRLRGMDEHPDHEEDPAHVRTLVLTKAALRMLSPTARRALLLRYRERRSYEDIAADLGVTVRAAEKLVMNAESQLRRWEAERETRE